MDIVTCTKSSVSSVSSVYTTEGNGVLRSHALRKRMMTPVLILTASSLLHILIAQAFYFRSQGIRLYTRFADMLSL
jgi:hypothetical protein